MLGLGDVLDPLVTFDTGFGIKDMILNHKHTVCRLASDVSEWYERGENELLQDPGPVLLLLLQTMGYFESLLSVLNFLFPGKYANIHTYTHAEGSQVYKNACMD